MQKEVERKRRETINQGISNLAALLPPDMLSQSTTSTSATEPAKASSSKPAKEMTNKSSILQLTQSYILQLRASEQRLIEKWTLEKLLMEQRVRETEAERDAWRKKAEAAEAELKRARAGEGTTGAVDDGGRDKKRVRVEDGEVSLGKGKGEENGTAEGA